MGATQWSPKMLKVKLCTTKNFHKKTENFTIFSERAKHPRIIVPKRTPRTRENFAEVYQKFEQKVFDFGDKFSRNVTETSQSMEQQVLGSGFIPFIQLKIITAGKQLKSVKQVKRHQFSTNEVRLSTNFALAASWPPRVEERGSSNSPRRKH